MRRKMRAAIKRRWVAALRSGDYLQTRGTMCDQTGAMCCLGVLCDVAAGPKGVWKKRHSGAWAYFDTPGGDGHMAVPPVSLLTDVGLPSITTTILAEMNDMDKKSFTEIADWIEENL